MYSTSSTRPCFHVVIILIALTQSALAAERTPPSAPALLDLDAYPQILGTQTIGAAYQFTGETKLVETAEAIRAMGSNTLKCALRPTYFGPTGNVPAKNPGVKTLTELVRDEPSHRRVLDMPFSHYFFWAYCFTAKPWGATFTEKESAAEYAEMYELCRYLLQTYNGSGKTFYLGNWEGDWSLLGHYDAKKEPTAGRIASMIAWLNTRQRAVDDAKRDTPHRNVNVFHYVEVNLVRKGLAGKACVTNDVLPKTNVDYVSYSAYDSQGGDIARDLPQSLDYIEQKLPAKEGIAGKRVFIGEYGFASQPKGPKVQDEQSRKVITTAMRWGCPFILYWAFYNNEVSPEGQHKGFWLIDDKGQKQPIYETHRRYFEWAKAYVAETKLKTGKLPTPEQFREAALKHLE